MKQVRQAQTTLERLSELVRLQESEIKRLRYIVARYQMKHGDEISDGITNLAESHNFHVQQHPEKTICKIVDHEKLGLDSDFMRIQKIINELNEKQ